MALNDPDAFDELLARMRSFIPQLKKDSVQEAPIRRIEKEYIRIGDESVYANTASTRARRFSSISPTRKTFRLIRSGGHDDALGMLTVLLGPFHPKILSDG